MRVINARKLAALMSSACLPIAPVSADDVFVRGVQEGHGFSRVRGTGCYVVAPAHVVGDQSGVKRVAGVNQRSTDATLEGFWGDDLAILHLEAADARSSFCSPSTPLQLRDVAELLQSNGNRGELRLRMEGGALRTIPVVVTQDDGSRYLYVSSSQANESLGQTMSGGLMYVGGVMVGMLMEVDTGSGSGIVHRAEYVEDGVRQFFAAIARPKRSKATIESTVAPLDAAGTELLALAEGVLKLVEAGEYRELFDLHLSVSWRNWITWDFFSQYLANHYGALRGVEIQRRLVLYISPGTLGATAAGEVRQWMLVVESAAGAAKFQETLTFVRDSDSWKLSGLSKAELL